MSLFWFFFKIGWFTFGGGWSIVAQIQKEFVDKRKWISEAELLDFTSVGRSLPGLMIGNVSFMFGYHMAGLLGGVASVAGMTLPSVIILALVTLVYNRIRDNVYVMRALKGVRAAVIPIMLLTVQRLGKAALRDAGAWIIGAGALVLSLFTPLNKVWVVLMGAAVGIGVERMGRHGTR